MEEIGYLVIGRSTCPYCDGAENLLKEKMLAHQRLDLDLLPSMAYDTLSTVLHEHLDYQYVPMVFHNGEFIGGLAELRTHIDADTCTC